MTILDRIIERKKEIISISEKTTTISELKEKEYYARKTYSLQDTLFTKNGIIAEFKRKSPSKGLFSENLDPIAITTNYQKNNASAVSILTDQDFFGGNLEDVINARPHLEIPILRKDFMIAEYQFHEAKAMGADLILLIAACLSPNQVKEFTHLSHELGLEVLLEIHTEKELEHLHPDIDFVGINNRNLKDFKVDLQHSIALKNRLPEGTITIAESGIYQPEDFIFLKKKGFDGFLMGEYFMKGNSMAEFNRLTRKNETQ